MQCGSCTQQAASILTNPLLWMAALAALTTVVSKTTTKRKK